MASRENSTASRQLLSLAVVFAVIGSTSAFAAKARPEAPGDQPLDEIVVVAHKSERSVREVAANITIVSRQDLNDILATSTADVFRYAPGIDYEASGSRFGTEGINIRGIGGNRVAILVDGVPLGDQFDIGSFSNATRDFINAGLIQRVEVLHGPASALYGSAAIGGVVALRTPDPDDLLGDAGFGGDVLGTWRGADRSMHGTGMVAAGNDTAGFLVGGSLRSGQQLESAAAPDDLDLRDYERRTALVKFVTDDRLDNSWRLGYIHQDSAVLTDLNSMLGTGRYRSTSALEGDDNYTMDLFNAGYEFGTPGRWIDGGFVRAYYEATDVSQRTLDERALSATPVSIDRLFSFEQAIRGAELNLQKSVELARTTHKLGFGIEYRERRTTEFRDGLSTDLLDGSTSKIILGEAFPLRDFPISESTERGAYIEDVVTAGQWTLIGALRADRYELAPVSDAIYEDDYPFAEPVSVSESDLSPKLGVIYRLNSDTDIYIQYAHGFRAPPYEDANIGLEIPMFNIRAIPNPELKSESSDGFDVGMRWQRPNTGFRLSIFRTRYTDFIETKVRLGVDPVSGRILFQSQNLARTVIEGLEGGGHFDFGGVLERFRADASFYLARGKNRENGQPLNSVGPAQGVVGLTWSGPDARQQLRLQGTFTAAWDERDESAGELFQPAGHTVLDLYYSQRIGARTQLRAGFLNLTDKIYWNWSDVRGLVPGDPVLPYLAQPGRSASVSINFNWQ